MVTQYVILIDGIDTGRVYGSKAAAVKNALAARGPLVVVETLKTHKVVKIVWQHEVTASLDGAYTLSQPGARTLADVRPFLVGGAPVTVVISGRHGAVHIGCAVAWQGEVPAEVTVPAHVYAWAHSVAVR